MLQRAQATLERVPPLRRFYDDAFIEKITGTRIDNYLLFLLCQDADEDYVNAFWAGIIADLTLLEDKGAWGKYERRFHNTEYEMIQSARTELDLAARLARAGAEITFEPTMKNGRCPEFSAATSPHTWWEVKQVRDEAKVRHTNAVIEELQRQLATLPLPYRIHVDAEDVEPNVDVHALGKAIKAMVSEFHASGGRGKRVLDAHGIRAAIGGRSRGDRAHIGVMQQGYVFDETQTQRVRRSIKDAVKQLPAEGAGVVVVDGTVGEWLDVDTVEDACFGTERFWYTATSHGASRDADGIFHPQRNRRISAVIYYNRREFVGSSERYPPLVAFHNRFANIPLEADTLRMLGAIEQYRYVDAGRPGYVKREAF